MIQSIVGPIALGIGIVLAVAWFATRGERGQQ